MRSIIFFIFLGFLFSCKQDPGYPLEPRIIFKAIRYDASAQNIVVDLDFTDGDGDLGLEKNEITGDFNPDSASVNIFDTTKVSKVSNPFEDSTVVKLKYKLRVVTNMNFYNYYVSLLFKNKNGDFVECIDIPNCLAETSQNSKVFGSGFLKHELDSIFRKGNNGRFPFLGNKDRKSPISGVLTYNIIGGSLSQTVKGKTIKLKISILDKTLNRSNEILTDSLKF